MSFDVSQILAAARRNPALVTSETAAYIVLSLTEQSLSAPRRVGPEHALIQPGGAITIGEAPPCRGNECDGALRLLLGQLLDASALSSASDALFAVARGTGEGPEWLRAELQTALVPVNRAAARRALNRLHRRLCAAFESGEEPPNAPAVGRRRGPAGLTTPATNAGSERSFDDRDRLAALGATRMGRSGEPLTGMPGPAAVLGKTVAALETPPHQDVECVPEIVSGGKRTEVVQRRARRRGQIVEVTPSEDIPVAVDETAFRAACRSLQATTHESVQADADHSPRNEEWVSVNWHPAQTTPWQFRDATRRAGEGTPILGSLEVGVRETFEHTNVTSAVNDAAELAPDLDTSGSTSHWAAPESLTTADDACAEDWSDTVVDVAVTEARRQLGPYVPQVNVRRSSVTQLVERISMASLRDDDARKGLLEMVDAAASEQEFLPFGTATPPPVAHGTHLSSHAPSRRSPRRIVLSALTAIGVVVGAWILRPTSSELEPVSVASSPEWGLCEARVHVEVPNNARVFLNDSVERVPQLGPLALFDAVRCAEPAELTVHVPSPSGSPLPDAWVRMPLPEAELRQAARTGQPMHLSPLGDTL